MPFDFIRTDRFTMSEAFALADPPTWTRLEPQSTTGDPRPGIEARVHDPLWLLARQWQLGEFQGEDAGTPITVRVVSQTQAVDRWAPAGVRAGRSISQTPQDLLDPLIEREPVTEASPGFRARAEAGAALLASLDEAGFADSRASIVGRCALDLDPLSHPDGAHAQLDPQFQRLVRLLGATPMADAERFARAFEAAGDLPDWLTAADVARHAPLRAVIDPWLAWYRSEVSPLPGGEDCWRGERLEYQFNVGVGATVLAAPEHGGGDIDWISFDPAPDVPLDAPAGAEPGAVLEPGEGAVPGGASRVVQTVLATPLRYPGMPADRFWEMEDAQVNVGAIEAEPWDLARLLVAEFALTCGNDWLVVPVDVPFGSLTTLESVTYTNNFGERYRVQPTTQASPDGRWRMFTIAGRSGDALDGLLVPPGAVTVQDGPAIEEVLFLRDEMANMVWAVERAVQGPSGAARDRAREREDVPPFGAGPVESAQLDYQLQSGVPARWIPFLPRSAGYRAVDLVQGRITRPDGTPVMPLGRILARADLASLRDAEVPREGVLVRRVPSMTRRADGTVLRWVTRRVNVGRGEGASNLAFDAAVPRRPRG